MLNYLVLKSINYMETIKFKPSLFNTSIFHLIENLSYLFIQHSKNPTFKTSSIKVKVKIPTLEISNSLQVQALPLLFLTVLLTQIQ